MFRRISRRGWPALCAALVFLVAGVASGCGTNVAAAPTADHSPAAATGHDVLSIARVQADVKAGRVSKDTLKSDVAGLDHPLSPKESRERWGVPVYGATALRHTYGLDRLRLPRSGQRPTVALIMPYQVDRYQESVAKYAQQWGLTGCHAEAMTHGQVPVADPDDPNQSIVGEEGLLDSDMICATGLNVNVLYLQVTPEVLDGPAGFVHFGQELIWLAKHRHIDAVTASYGWFEANYTEFYGDRAKAAAELRKQSDLFKQVVQRLHVTVLTADGDTGPTGPSLDGSHLYPKPTPAFFAASPWATGVSATTLHVADDGTRLSPDTVWGQVNNNGFATGGAPSAYFSRPYYQKLVHDIPADPSGQHRLVGDFSMNGSLESEVWLYSPVYNALYGQAPGWIHAAGTSAASPMFAGVVADAVAVAGHPLGLINPALYWMARTPASAARSGILDVTEGDNSVTGVPGYPARVGYDPVTGDGTVGNGVVFVHTLAATVPRLDKHHFAKAA